MNLALRLMNGQRIVIEDVKNWSVNESGLNILDINDKNYWYNKAYIAVIEEEKKETLQVIKP